MRRSLSLVCRCVKHKRVMGEGACTAYCLGPESNQQHLELRDTLEVTVCCDDGKAVLQSGSGDQGIDITDKTGAVRRA